MTGWPKKLQRKKQNWALGNQKCPPHQYPWGTKTEREDLAQDERRLNMIHRSFPGSLKPDDIVRRKKLKKHIFRADTARNYLKWQVESSWGLLGLLCATWLLTVLAECAPQWARRSENCEPLLGSHAHCIVSLLVLYHAEEKSSPLLTTFQSGLTH